MPRLRIIGEQQILHGVILSKKIFQTDAKVFSTIGAPTFAAEGVQFVDHRRGAARQLRPAARGLRA